MDFDDFYKVYPKKVDKKRAQGYWLKMSEEDKLAAVEGAKREADRVRKGYQEKRFLVNAATYLLNERWEDEHDDHEPAVNSRDSRIERTLHKIINED